jgi:hypothetical protein
VNLIGRACIQSGERNVLADRLTRHSQGGDQENDDLAQTRLGTVLRAGAAVLAASPPAAAGLSDGNKSCAARTRIQFVGAGRRGCGPRSRRASRTACGCRAHRRLRSQRYRAARFHPLFAPTAINQLGSSLRFCFLLVLYARGMEISHPEYIEKQYAGSAAGLAEGHRLYGSEDARKIRGSRDSNGHTF